MVINMKALKILFIGIVFSILFTACGDKIISKSYVGTYKLHEVDGYYIAKGTNEEDKMEYIFQAEPIDKSDTLSDNIDVTEGVKIRNSTYSEEEKEKILKEVNKSISKESAGIFKGNLGKENTVSVFAVSYKDSSGKVNTKYEYELIAKDDKIKDFDEN